MRKHICSICEREISTNTIIFHLNKKHLINNIDAKKIKLNLIAHIDLRLEIVNDYLIEELCVKDISEKRNITYFEIVYILNEQGVVMRNHREAHNAKGYFKNHKKVFLEKYGVTNPSKLDFVKIKKVNTMIENYGRTNNFQNNEIQKDAQSKIDYVQVWNTNKNILSNKYGVENFSQIEGVQEKISKTKKEKISKLTPNEKRKLTENMRSKLHGWTSNLEIRVKEILNELHIPYEHNKYILGFNYDIIFKNKVILEIQGDFWHANPKKYLEEDILNFPKKKKKAKDIWEYDLLKKKTVEEEGYKVIYLWEFDLNKMKKEDVVDFINLNIL